MIDEMHRFYGPDGTFWGHLRLLPYLEMYLKDRGAVIIPMMKGMPVTPSGEVTAVPPIQEFVLRKGNGRDGREGVLLVRGEVDDVDLFVDIMFVPSVGFLRAMGK